MSNHDYYKDVKRKKKHDKYIYVNVLIYALTSKFTELIEMCWFLSKLKKKAKKIVFAHYTPLTSTLIFCK